MMTGYPHFHWVKFCSSNWNRHPCACKKCNILAHNLFTCSTKLSVENQALPMDHKIIWVEIGFNNMTLIYWLNEYILLLFFIWGKMLRHSWISINWGSVLAESEVQVHYEKFSLGEGDKSSLPNLRCKFSLRRFYLEGQTIPTKSHFSKILHEKFRSFHFWGEVDGGVWTKLLLPNLSSKFSSYPWAIFIYGGW